MGKTLSIGGGGGGGGASILRDPDDSDRGRKSKVTREDRNMEQRSGRKKELKKG